MMSLKCTTKVSMECRMVMTNERARRPAHEPYLYLYGATLCTGKR